MVFYPWVMYLLTMRIIEEFGLLIQSLFSNYKVMLLLCHLRVKLNSDTNPLIFKGYINYQQQNVREICIYYR